MWRGFPSITTRRMALARPMRALRGFEMPPGEQAAVAHHDYWEDEASGQPMWNYKIKVFPWTVFALVTIRMEPAVDVAHIWAATEISKTKDEDEDVSVLVVELGHKSQDDFTFAVDGTGGPIKKITLSCANVEVPAETG